MPNLISKIKTFLDILRSRFYHSETHIENIIKCIPIPRPLIGNTIKIYTANEPNGRHGI